jgi:hypothetical protein
MALGFLFLETQLLKYNFYKFAFSGSSQGMSEVECLLKFLFCFYFVLFQSVLFILGSVGTPFMMLSCFLSSSPPPYFLRFLQGVQVLGGGTDRS